MSEHGNISDMPDPYKVAFRDPDWNADAIIRELAINAPYMNGDCVWCGIPFHNCYPETIHEPDCLIARARSWVDRNPA